MFTSWSLSKNAPGVEYLFLFIAALEVLYCICSVIYPDGRKKAAKRQPEMDRLVAEAVKAIGGEIDSLRVPRLQGVVLGGGYGRGEGGVRSLEFRVQSSELRYSYPRRKTILYSSLLTLLPPAGKRSEESGVRSRS